MSRWDAPDGVSVAFDSLDRVMDTCDRLGLRVILELEGQNPAFQFGPDFRFDLDQVTVTDRYKHWLNYYHPAVDAAIVEYCRQVAAHFKDHPALWGYDLFNEVNFHSADRYTIAAFRQWLRQKYRDTRTLNRAGPLLHLFRPGPSRDVQICLQHVVQPPAATRLGRFPRRFDRSFYSVLGRRCARPTPTRGTC